MGELDADDVENIKVLGGLGLVNAILGGEPIRFSQKKLAQKNGETFVLFVGMRFDGLIPERRWIEDKICIYVGFIPCFFFRLTQTHWWNPLRKC